MCKVGWGRVGWGGPPEVHHFLTQHIKRHRFEKSSMLYTREVGWGRWEVGGGKWEVGGGRWEVGGGRWDE